MKLYFLKQDALDTLRGNLKTNLKKYMSPTNEWILDFFDGQSPFIEYKKEVDNFTLDMSSDRENTTDLENVKRIYTAMKMLSETDASDERLWAGLAHGQFWEFMRYRWQYDKEIPEARNIETRFMFGYGKRASNYRNTLSKLWWVGRLTYDENRKTPFELTDVLKRDFTTRVNDLLYSNMYSANPVICRSFLSAVKFHEDRGASINGEIFRKTTQFLNVLGGTYILDYFEEDELKEKIIKEINRLIKKDKLSHPVDLENVNEKDTNISSIESVSDNNITQINMVDIAVDFNKFHTPPYKGKVEAVKEYYKINNTIDKPILVVKDGDKYLLKDKYLRYYVAKELKLKEIPAIIESIDSKIKINTDINKTKSVSNVGYKRVRHNIFGEGTVLSISNNIIKINFDKFGEKELSLYECNKKDLIIFI